MLTHKSEHSGADDRGRTDTDFTPLDFESSASANSTTSAFWNGNYIIINQYKSQPLFMILGKKIENQTAIVYNVHIKIYGDKNMKLPKEFCDRMQELTGDEFNDFIKSYDTQINRGIRINTLKCDDVDAVARVLGVRERVEWCPSGYYAGDELSGKHPYHGAGIFYFQEPSAQSVAEYLPITDDSKILDLCAAPGGKTTHIGARMKNKGLLVANEIISKRAAVLSENVERMGLTNTIVTNESPSRLAEKFRGYFDGIIVDAPCSGEGMFRKEPQAVEEWSVAHTLSCGVRQKNILDDAYKMLKCGGYIMYSTCTFSYDENEAVVQYMIDTYNMELCHIDGLDMLSHGIGEGMENCRRIFPHKNKGEGHFTALLKRTEENDCIVNKKKNSKSDIALNDAIKLYRDFEKKSLNIKCEGEFVLFGDNLYLLPEAVDIDKLRVLRCGLHLGAVKKNRFEPAHALSHAFENSIYINKVEIPLESPDVNKYLHGETIESPVTGWCVVAVDGHPLGWGKGSNGIVKNHYPKALRIL